MPDHNDPPRDNAADGRPPGLILGPNSPARYLPPNLVSAPHISTSEIIRRGLLARGLAIPVTPDIEMPYGMRIPRPRLVLPLFALAARGVSEFVCVGFIAGSSASQSPHESYSSTAPRA
eukprot:IDg15324t1